MQTWKQLKIKANIWRWKNSNSMYKTQPTLRQKNEEKTVSYTQVFTVYIYIYEYMDEFEYFLSLYLIK